MRLAGPPPWRSVIPRRAVWASEFDIPGCGGVSGGEKHPPSGSDRWTVALGEIHGAHGPNSVTALPAGATPKPADSRWTGAGMEGALQNISGPIRRSRRGKRASGEPGQRRQTPRSPLMGPSHEPLPAVRTTVTDPATLVELSHRNRGRCWGSVQTALGGTCSTRYTCPE